MTCYKRFSLVGLRFLVHVRKAYVERNCDEPYLAGKTRSGEEAFIKSVFGGRRHRVLLKEEVQEVSGLVKLHYVVKTMSLINGGLRSCGRNGLKFLLQSGPC
jgi:hypothetical protein